ncbi:MAG UNVERIFIED_CONTAM: hypothetical protein LVR18_46750 [Planctomycetaceae bacterium]|jgi:hypothetical protein
MSLTASNGGNITIASTGSANFGSLAVATTGTVSVYEDSDTALSGASSAGTLNLTSGGAVTDVGAQVTVSRALQLTGASISIGILASTTLNVAGDAVLTANNGGNITLGDVGSVNFNALTFSTTGAVVIYEDSATQLKNSSSAGSLSLTSSAGLTDGTGTAATLAVTGSGQALPEPQSTSVTMPPTASQSAEMPI